MTTFRTVIFIFSHLLLLTVGLGVGLYHGNIKLQEREHEINLQLGKLVDLQIRQIELQLKNPNPCARATSEKQTNQINNDANTGSK